MPPPQTPAFTHAIFLRHSAKDKEVVRAAAELLRQDGLKVGIDEWVPKAGDQASKPGSSRGESAQTSVRQDRSMSGLTSAATRDE
ncbi:MAG: hypothetical protein EXS31_10030 [Pedosphaera sp.]|nr:hypothetical protein [Pedosphaera sp.]